MKPLADYINTMRSKLNTIAAETSSGFIVFLAALVTVLFVAAMVWGR